MQRFRMRVSTSGTRGDGRRDDTRRVNHPAIAVGAALAVAVAPVQRAAEAIDHDRERR